jgi:Xaa-Pro aminopeptidase
MEDRQRIDRIRQELATGGLDALLCQLGPHVLMLSGYAPVLGISFALFPLRGEIGLVVPLAEESCARQGWVRDVRTYEIGAGGTTSILDSAMPVLQTLIADRGLNGATIGYEGSAEMVPASYTQVGFPPVRLLAACQHLFPRARFVDVAPLLDVLQAWKSTREVECIRMAAEVAAMGIEAGREKVQVGNREAAVAAAVEGAIQLAGRARGVGRVQGFAHVMSGARSALAYHPFTLTTDREIQPSDPVLVQLEVYADGYWAEVTRTFFAGEPGAEGRRIYEACLEAQSRAIQAVRDGAAAADVDAAARDYLTRDGFGQLFRHGLGHEVGFQAISHLQPPRLDPRSTDTLRTGMVFNIEPGVYVHGWGGVRVNDVAVCQRDQAEILTAGIPRDLTYAIVPQRRRA